MMCRCGTRNPRTYADMGEYEIFEFDLGRTFNYAEMAALIAPRPFMVERGHHDGVADDWTTERGGIGWAARPIYPHLAAIWNWTNSMQSTANPLPIHCQS
jgi:hypothetical protein